MAKELPDDRSIADIIWCCGSPVLGQAFSAPPDVASFEVIAPTSCLTTTPSVRTLYDVGGTRLHRPRASTMKIK